MNILFIGNSYTYYNDMPEIFEKLARDNGKDVSAYSVTEGGINLYKFTDNTTAVTQKLNSVLAERKYDICFMQDHSLVPVQNSGLFISGVALLHRKIKQYIPTIYLYQTWGRKRISDDNPKLWNIDEGMTKGLSKMYKDAATMLKLKVSTVGENFYNLHLASPEIELYEEDCSHPSYKGSCLIALTHYHTVFGEFPANTDSLQLSNKEISDFKLVVCK